MKFQLDGQRPTAPFLFLYFSIVQILKWIIEKDFYQPNAINQSNNPINTKFANVNANANPNAKSNAKSNIKH